MAIINFTNYSRGQSKGCMSSVMNYVMKDEKTVFNGQQLVTGIDCIPVTAYGDFMTTKNLYHKTEGVLFYHMIQSFPKDETVDPLTAHAAALKLAEYYSGYEVLVCTHTDRDHIHSHFLINSVSFEAGKKLHIAKEQLQELRQRNDRVCREFSLPVFIPDLNRSKTKSMTVGEYHTAARGESKKLLLMNVINDCMRHAASREEFISLMESEGYKVRWETDRRNITYTNPDGWRCRDQKLFGDKYLKEMMELEFTLRAEFIYGRADGTQPSRIYGTERRTDSRIVYRGAVSDSGRAGEVDTAAGATGKQMRMAGEVSEGIVRDTVFVSDPNADGRPTEVGTASGSDSRTGWEEEREAFLSSKVQTAQTVPAGMGVAHSANRSVDVGGIVSSVVQLGRRMEQAHAPVIDGSAHHHKGRKTWLNELDKRIAMGHKEDDHEDPQPYTTQQIL